MKIIVSHVPAGSGHQRACEAILEALRHLGIQGEVQLLNALEGSSHFYQWCFTQGYLQVIHSAPFLWGIGYHATDWAPWSRLILRLHRLMNRIHAQGLIRIFDREQPDCIVATHFLPVEVAAYWKRSRGRKTRVIAVITDYLAHTLWIAEGVDLYGVGSGETRDDLIRRGVPAERIEVLGIPVDLKFSRPLNRQELLSRFRLDGKQATILIGSGGSGTGPVLDLVRLLEKVDRPLQLIVVAGNNERLVQTLEALRPGLRHPMIVHGFIRNMEELMEVSTLMVTKAGGLTCAEACAKGLPLVLVAPIPGQEARNARAMVEQGAALLAETVSDVPGIVARLIDDPAGLERLAQSARRTARPDAAMEIARRILT